MQARKVRLIIDCDPGHDDALALILAHHAAEVVGVTTVSGNAPLQAVTANALAVLDLLGAATPVHSGADGPIRSPLDGKPPHALHVHGEQGLGGSQLPVSGNEVCSAAAVEFLLETTQAAAGLWVVAIGPLTNIALAIERDPTFPSRIAGISIMGGSTSGGNVTPAAEFNIWADPEAADRVFRSGARIRLCGLNLTHQFTTSASMLERLRNSVAPKAAFAVDLIAYLHRRMGELTGAEVAALHDPCAVLAVTHPELFEFQSREVAVELEGTLTRGMTVVDERASGRKSERKSERAPTIEVAYRLDAEAAMTLLLESLEIDG